MTAHDSKTHGPVIKAAKAQDTLMKMKCLESYFEE